MGSIKQLTCFQTRNINLQDKQQRSLVEKHWSNLDFVVVVNNISKLWRCSIKSKEKHDLQLASSYGPFIRGGKVHHWDNK